MSSFFNLGSFVHSGEPVTKDFADTSDYSGVHDAETGLDVRFHTPGQRRSYLARHPDMVGKLPPVADPNRIPVWDDASTINGAPASLQRKYERIGRESGLLKDPVANTRKIEPTKPVVRTSEQTTDVAWHEALHCAAALHNGVRVLSATIVREGNTDGLTTMLLDRNDCPFVHAFVSLAAEVGAAWLGYPAAPETYASDRDIGGTLEWRETVRALVRDELPEFIGGAMEIARQLMVKQTLDEFHVKAAHVRGQRRVKEQSGGSAKHTSTRQRYFDFSKPEHVRAFNAQMGRPLNAEPIGYCDAHLVADSFK
jgi:hypothetical protein